MTGRRRLLGALLVTTALSAPAPAQAGVVVGFVQGIIAGIANAALVGGTFATAGFTAGFAISSYVTGFFGTLAGRALLALGTSALVSALTPQPELPKPSQRLSNYNQSAALMERAYGKLRKGGPVGFRSGLVDNRRHMTVTLASHPTNGPVSHYLDFEEVTVNEVGNVVSDRYRRSAYSATDTERGSYVNLRTHTGGPSQAVDAILDAEFTEITSNHDFAGHSYAAIQYRRAAAEKALQVYTQGREPDYAPVWEFWNEIYDPRDDSTGYSNNWALCFAHELVHIWGFEVDWDRVAIEADVCDESVTNRDGGSQSRYTFNHTFTDDQNFEQVRAQFIAAANGFIWQRPDGKVDFYAGRWIEPTLTLTASDFESLSMVEGNFGMNPPTEYVAEYREPGNAYRETPSAPFIVDAVAGRIARPLAIYGIDNHNQALRVLKPLARSERAPIKLSGTLRLAGFEVIGGREWSGSSSGANQLAHRFVTVQHPILLRDVTCEVSMIEMNADGTSFQIELAESVEDDWSFIAATEEPAPPSYNNDDVSGSDPVDPITDLAGSVVEGTGGVAQIMWTWTAPDDLFPVLRLRRDGDEWVEVELQEGASEYIQTGLVDGATYEAQIRARTSGYDVSEWKPDTPLSVVAVANTTAPAAHGSGNLSVSKSGSDVTVAFTSPDDAAYYATRIYRADYAAAYSGPFDLGDAVLVRTEYGLPDADDEWLDASLAAGVYAYWVAPINASGIEGDETGPETIEIV
ncbi:hypothetical protein KZZ07_16490 [Mameliella sp. CS4]|uniref:hypothetical protein n=1 Tax=Mameliella sp. CS4 TaxID=2862329 RepID=UPI001C5CF440|nr:hypothetical protein [Mameliella sp. CS4]MBW4984143.1 hypothetical protein [Mameliella sp. CS4]